MAESTIKLPDGTVITIRGNPEEIKRIVSIYSFKDVKGAGTVRGAPAKKSKKEDREEDMVMTVVNCIKNSDEASVIEENILDRSSQVDRVLLPLYIVEKYLSGKIFLTSGHIYHILKELGINMLQPNISKTLRGTALKYVIGDKKVKPGAAVGYKISRQGLKYISKVLGD